MAIFFDAPVDPDAITEYVRTVPLNSALRLAQMFPTRVHNDNRVNILEITRTNRVAKFRAFDGAINVTPRDSGLEKYVPLPALSSAKPPIGEYERLQLQFAQTGGQNIQALADAIYNDADALTREVHNRWELAWGDVLTDGKLTTAAATENGYIFEADYGVPSGVTTDTPGGSQLVTAGTSWVTIATADVLADLIAWCDVYVANNGVPPANFLTSRRVLRLMQTNAKIIAAVTGTAAGRTRVTQAEVNDLLASEGLPVPLAPYDSSLVVDNTDTGAATQTRVIADDKVIFLPENMGALGHNAVGISATALELVRSTDSDLTFADAPGIVGVVVKNPEPPFREMPFVDAVGMPVLDNAKLLMVADVVP
jgi:Phage major capsid protein E